MTEMTMNRAIHAAVRRDLDRTEAALRALRDGDRARAAELSRAWRHLHAELVDHHEKEDELIWPALRGLGVDPALLETMEHEHGAMRDALDDTDRHMRVVETSAAAADAEAAAASVVSTRRVVEHHLTHEEQELEPELLRRQDTEEWKAVEKQLRRGSPVRAGRMFAWVLDGASPEVRAYLRGAFPAPVLLLLTKVLGNGYQRTVAPVWRT